MRKTGLLLAALAAVALCGCSGSQDAGDANKKVDSGSVKAPGAPAGGPGTPQVKTPSAPGTK